MPRATAQGIHFRSTAIVQSVSGDARDVPLTTEFLGWSYVWELGSVKVAHFFGNDARFTGQAQAARRSIIAPSSELTHAGRPYELTLLVSTVFLFVIALPSVQTRVFGASP